MKQTLKRFFALVMTIFGVVLLTVLMLIGMVLLIGGMAEKITSMAVVGFVFFVVGLAITIVFIGKRNSKENNREAQANGADKKVSSDLTHKATVSQKLTYREKVLQNREKAYRKMKYKFTFVSGLPLMQGSLCKVVSTTDRIVIEGQGTTFELPKKKITSITIEKNVTHHTQAVSSAGGAVAGAMVFGAIGAAIGGRTVVKNVKSQNYYLVITYFDNEEHIKYIVFDNCFKAVTLVEDFKKFNKNDRVKKVVEID